jgi:hypothetical protein
MNEQKDAPLYIDVKAMTENKVGFFSSGIAVDIICLIWWPTKDAFDFDPKSLALRLATELPARGYTEQTIQDNAEGIKTFFTVLSDGKWAPNPKFFSLSNGNSGAAS